MVEYYVIPTIGQFKVTIIPQYDFYNRKKVSFYILNVGGNLNKCVNITIHSEISPRSKELLLSWTEAIDKQCIINSQIIKGGKTVEMVNLAFTIAREIAPYAEHVTLNDMSFFICNTPEGRKKISLPPYYIAFYNKTWYEDKFNAVMTNEDAYAKYKVLIKNMDIECVMPQDFDFGNLKIRELLQPLYYKARTWNQFFKLIEEHHPHDKCVLMYPWITAAMGIIFKGDHLYIGQEWKIFLSNVPIVHYYQINKTHITGGEFNKKYENQYYNYRDVNYITPFLISNTQYNI